MVCDLPDGIDWEASGLRQDARFAIAPGRITVAGQFEFVFSDAPVWRPISLSDDWTIAKINIGLDALEAAAAPYDLTDGLAALVRRDGRAIVAAQNGIDALGDWLKGAVSAPRNERNEPTQEIASIIGLGPGLTPSGDDLIGGTLVALNMFGHHVAADCLANWSLPIARRSTGKISIAHLARAAKGEGAEALHRTIAAIADGNEAALHSCLRDIDAIGHSSGWDALAGAVAVMRRVSRQ
jgi:hypothetical protein